MVKQTKEERAKRLLYGNRKRCVLRKAEELSTLCDVKVCAIIIPPETATGEKIKLETYPNNLHNVKEILDALKTSHKTVRSEQPHKYRTKGPSITDNKKDINSNNNNVIATSNDTPLCSPSPLLSSDNWPFLNDFESGIDMMDTSNAVVPLQWYGNNNAIIDPPPISSVATSDQNMLVNHSHQWNENENEYSYGKNITFGAGYDESVNMVYSPQIQYPLSTNIVGPNMAMQGSTLLPQPSNYSDFGYFAI